MAWHDRIWYESHLLRYALWPLAALFRVVVALRRSLYRFGLLRVHRFRAPVVVVGNISVGGTGKTPLTLWLARHLAGQGRRPGVVARGYGGTADRWPQRVRPDSDPGSVGDEAVLLARLGHCPVCVGPDRPAAVRALLEHDDCDLVISDDGLQHYAMGRDIEIIVVDGERRFGNGLMLPAGPLREPPARLRQADLIVCNGAPRGGEYGMRLSDAAVLSLADAATVEPELQPLAAFSGRAVHAIAGLGNAGRYFALLREHGLVLHEHRFPDHHGFTADDLRFDDDLPVLMTDKDAVKCQRFAGDRHWIVRIRMTPDDAFVARLTELLTGLEYGSEAA